MGTYRSSSCNSIGASCRRGISSCFFLKKNSSILKLTTPVWDVKAIIKGCTNGSSEFMSGVAASIASILYNVQLLKYAGEDGVAAYGVMMYLSMIFASMFMGYANGIAPVIGFHLGAGNHKELRNLRTKSLKIIGVFSIAVFTVSEIITKSIASIFVGYDQQLMNLTVEGLRIFSMAFLFMGFSIFWSSFFTALNNGLVSAFIAFMRTLVFEIGAVLILPMFFGVDGIWSSVVIAEFMATIIGCILMLRLRGRYHY